VNSDRISLALATYNGARFIEQLLDSIVNQTLKPFEIVVCDDASQDETVTILNKYKAKLPLRIYVNDKSIGVVKNFTKIASLCTGEYIAFCDQDDIWLPNKLSSSITEIKKIDGLLPAMVFSDLTVVDEDLKIISKSYWQHRKLKPEKETFSSLLYGNIVTGCTIVINQAMKNEVLLMPSDILMHDFWIACIAYGIGRYSFIRQPLILYRQHLTNVTNNDAVTWISRLKKNANFFLENSISTHYLLDQIKQAKKFSNLYSARLSNLNKEVLHDFTNLENKPPFIRKWKTFLIKYLYIHVIN